MSGDYVVYGGAGTGSVAVEAALTLAGAPYRLEGTDWRDIPPDAAFARVNPMRQVPAVVLPSGELMTESLAILLHIAETFPEARLAPAVGAPRRPAFLRWMSYLATQVYALYWIRDVPSRIAEGAEAEALVKERTHARILDCWRVLGEGLQANGRFVMGDEISVLDVYLAVLSRWGPRRKGFYAAAPDLAPVVRAADADPRLAGLWAERMPFSEGWEG